MDARLFLSDQVLTVKVRRTVDPTTVVTRVFEESSK